MGERMVWWLVGMGGVVIFNMNGDGMMGMGEYVFMPGGMMGIGRMG